MVTRQNEEWLQEPASPAALLFLLENWLSTAVLQPCDGEAPSNGLLSARPQSKREHGTPRSRFLLGHVFPEKTMSTGAMLPQYTLLSL